MRVCVCVWLVVVVVGGSLGKVKREAGVSEWVIETENGFRCWKKE